MKVIDLDHLVPLKRRKLTEKEKEFILKAYGYRCAVRRCTGQLDLKNAIFHHRIPLNIGGTNELHNYAPICELDHTQLHGILATKSDQDPIVYTFVRLVPRPRGLARRKKMITEDQKELARIKLGNNQELVATIIANEKLDLRIFVNSDRYSGPTKRGVRFYLFDGIWDEFKKLVAKIDKEVKELE